ncbi:MAG: hypothetical protein AAB963_01035 [Patescibacteria group bacterium]
MKWDVFKAKTEKFLLLNKEIVSSLENKKFSAKANIGYWLKTGKIISLKRGIYLVKERYEKETNKEMFLEYISNSLLKPSYLSLEYVMAKYALLSEPVFAFTSVTTATTRVIKNELSNFRYYSVTPELFTGYKIKYFLGAPIWEATKEKAVFDYIYSRFLKNYAINERIVNELRINWGEVNKVEWRKIKAYGQLCRSTKVKKAIALIEKMYF